jgi:NADH dehydrogenase FAD-containing subunit
MTIRLIYQYLYEYGSNGPAAVLRRLTARMRLTDFEDKPIVRSEEDKRITPKINIAVVGAGRVGVILAEELARRDLNIFGPVETENPELNQRIREYLNEFELHGIDNISLEL